MVLSNIAFVESDRCVGCPFDMPRAEGAKGGELVVSSDHRSVREDVGCVWWGSVDRGHLYMLKLGTCVPSERLGKFACVVVVVKCAISFCFSDPWPVLFEEGSGEGAVFDDV